MGKKCTPVQTALAFILFPCYHLSNHKECVRDKLVDRTATCPKDKVLKLG